ncbi:MAG: PAS domain S-box protein [Acidobacteriaceae bacterium]|nr:PAS domain S-box protein [Acidobacteriaceae bacterium]
MTRQLTQPAIYPTAQSGESLICRESAIVKLCPNALAREKVVLHDSPVAPHNLQDSKLPGGEDFYQRLADNSLGLLCCHDLDGFLIWINLAAAKSLGYLPEEGIGRKLDEFLVPEVRPLFQDYLRRIKTSGFDSGYMRLLARDGSERVWMYRNILDHGDLATGRVLGLALDVTDRVRMERSLHSSEERYRRLFEDAPIAYLELNLVGEIRRANQAASTLFGMPSAVLTGTSIDTLRNGSADDFTPALSTLTPGMDVRRRVQRFRTAGGTQLDIEIRVKPIVDETGAATGFRCALLDMTERLVAEEKIRSLNAELEQRVAARTIELQRSNSDLLQFAHVISHDLQAPLRQVRLLLDDALAKQAAGTVAASVECVESSVSILERMSSLIDGLLSYSTSGSAAREPVRPVDSGAVLAQTLLDLQASITETQAQVTYGPLPPVLMEPADLMRVFQNLLTNALKYRAQSPLIIRIDACQNDAEWIFSVADNGIGIDREHFQRIFLPFRRLHGSEYPGTGIGLAVCKKIVERRGGRIWVESVPRDGATFYFTVPR